MATADRADAVLEYADRLLDNDYVQDKLREAGEKMRGAKQRASKRRVDVASDTKLRSQLRDSALALNEAASAFRAGRTKPQPRWGVRLLVVGGIGAVAAAVALAANDGLREKLFGGDSQPSADPAPSPEPVADQATPVA